MNNAGCMIHEYKLDENELETNFATNTLGTYNNSLLELHVCLIILCMK